MSPSLHANVSHLHQTARYPLRAWLTALVAVTVLGLLTGIQLMAAPIKAGRPSRSSSASTRRRPGGQLRSRTDHQVLDSGPRWLAG